MLSRVCWGRWLVIGAALLAGQLHSTNVLAQSGLPVPRFVTIGAGEANLRLGPGQRYQIEWVYRRRGLPVEVIGEHEHWRRVRDWEGVEGWLHRSLLSGRRGFVLTGNRVAALRQQPRPDAAIVARVEPGVLGRLLRCPGVDAVAGAWCYVEVDAYSGWLPRETVWGLYPGETVD